MQQLFGRIAAKLMLSLAGTTLLTASLLPAYTQADATTSSCPPTGVTWSNNAKFTGEPDNYGGSDYILNNNQYNQQTNSTQTMYLTTIGGTWGLCGVFQPSSPVEVKSYPSISMTSSDNLGQAWNSYATIGFSYAQDNFTAATGDWQTMADMFFNSTSGSNALEVEFVTNRHESGTPAGTKLGTYRPVKGGPAWNAYENTSIQNAHTYFAFVPQKNANSAAIDLRAAFVWLHRMTKLNNGVVFPLNANLITFSYGPEIADIQNASTGGPVNGFAVTSFTTTLN